MKPDLILQHNKTKQIIILDTKFTEHSIKKGQYGNLTFDSNHLFQIYAYVKSQENKSEYYKKSNYTKK